jgi:4-oxalocrotonate tautomerase
MPIINIKITKGRDIETKSRLAKKISDLVSKELDIDKQWVTVLFDEYERNNWATNGELHSIKFGEGCGREGVDKSN